MNILALLIILVFIAGCEKLESPQPNQEIRERLFFQCLTSVPAGPASTKYNDWAEVVEQCGSQAYYMSMKPKQP